MTKHCFWS